MRTTVVDGLNKAFAHLTPCQVARLMRRIRMSIDPDNPAGQMSVLLRLRAVAPIVEACTST